MRTRIAPAADWKDAAAYVPLLAADRSLFAWEWLRRDRAYRKAAEGAAQLDVSRRSAADRQLEAGTWGLLRFEPPGSVVPHARPLWRREVHSAVLEATAEAPRKVEDSFDISRFGSLATVVRHRRDEEHLLLSDGLKAIRLDIVGISVTEGPVQLRYRLGGIAAAEAPLLSLRRLLALCRSGRFSASLHPPQSKAGRMILMLRAHDALLAGATQREIAETLLSGEARVARWRVKVPTLRSRVQRLLRSAEAMAAGGYRSLLRG